MANQITVSIFYRGAYGEMPYQHYLPAAFIGEFSLSNSGRPRERKVWVARRNVSSVFQVKSEKVGGRYNLYTLANEAPNKANHLDDTWSANERGLKPALDALIHADEKFEAKLWITKLVPFFTYLFVRGPDFNDRFEDRFAHLFGDPWPFKYIDKSNNTNNARIMEAQRLYAPIISAEWSVIHNTSSTPIITNDIGYSLHQNAVGQHGYAIPLGKGAVLALMFGPRHLKLDWDGYWFISGISHYYIDEVAVKDLNRALALVCQHEIFGATKETIEEARHSPFSSPKLKLAPGPGLLVDPNVPLVETAMHYFQLLSVIFGGPPDLHDPRFSNES